MERTTIAVDLAKSVFQVAVSNRPGKTAETHRLRRPQLSAFFAQRPSSTVVMEACGSAHHWGRMFAAMGHQVVLLPPSQVHPYVRRNKTDSADAKALLEAVRNDIIRPVPIKTIEQQILAALHRVRAGWLAERTARINTVRGVLRELGMVIPVGAPRVVPAVASLVEDADSQVPDGLRHTLWEVCGEIRELERRIKDVGHQLEALARQFPDYERLLSIPGVGSLTATALLAFRGRRAPFPDWASLRQLSGADTHRTLEWSHASFGGNLQTRGLLPAHAPHSRREIGLVCIEATDGAGTTSSLGNGHREAQRLQHGRRRTRQQTGAHHLGGVEAGRGGLRRATAAGVGQSQPNVYFLPWGCTPLDD
jgi:transposase